MALTYSWLQFIIRLEKHFNNDFPGTDFSVTRNELLLYINEAMSSGIIGQVYNGAKVLGALVSIFIRMFSFLNGPYTLPVFP